MLDALGRYLILDWTGRPLDYFRQYDGAILDHGILVKHAVDRAKRTGAQVIDQKVFNEARNIGAEACHQSHAIKGCAFVRLNDGGLARSRLGVPSELFIPKLVGRIVV
jgi:hypothetical protein